ncbi:MAG: GtrA family protein [Gammaproteobacteria bacterium]|jgi:putative flippase GtrA|nr:GtrA family protein [Gammaproteobacteria bacterium]
MSSVLSVQVWRFAVVGALGFGVDALVLTGLVRAGGYGLYEARLLSFAVAVTVTWVLNRRFTFRQRASRDRSSEYGRYFIVQGTGALINLGVYAAVLMAWPVLAAWPVLPLAVGSGAAMVFNFVGSRYFAYCPNA